MDKSIKVLKTLFITITAILFFGCSSDKIYKRVEDRSKIGKIDSFSLIATDKKLFKMAKNAAKSANISLGSSPYTIVVESSRYPSHCNNPLTPAYEASYDGYVKITIKKAFKKIYFIQQDFHDSVDEDTLEDLFEILKKDMKIR